MKLVKPSHRILTKLDGTSIIKNIERAGRTCYKSEDKITEDSANKFVEMVTKRGHHSVIEHEGISVKFVCDRGVTHEIVRHRLAAYSQESTRYCNYSGGVTFIIPPWTDLKEGDYPPGDYWPDSEYQVTQKISCFLWFKAMLDAEHNYITLLKEGWSPQQARSVLPNSLKTEIVMSANLREWRHVLTLRCAKASHPQMNELMLPLLAELQEKIPILFSDINQ
jgi:thymidylate synthase (FAD)